MRGPTVVGLVWSTLVAGGLVGVPTQPKLAGLAVVDGQDNYRHRQHGLIPVCAVHKYTAQLLKHKPKSKNPAPADAPTVMGQGFAVYQQKDCRLVLTGCRS